MNRALISPQTAADVGEVVRFFGIDMEWNRHIFSHAAQSAPQAFESVMAALAAAIREDIRRGATGRVRQAIKDKGKR